MSTVINQFNEAFAQVNIKEEWADNFQEMKCQIDIVDLDYGSLLLFVG